MEYDDDVKIPLELQMWLLDQSGNFLRAKLDDNKYEAACVLFERLLCGYRKKELKGKLQLAYSDLIKQLESVKRWDFVKAACPYVIQCTAQVLSNRRNLGMSDRLSVAVTKLLSTLHWCFIDAPIDCDLDPWEVVYPAKSIELFIQLLIPCANEIHEQDLTFSLKSGMLIWQPLWRNLCPDIPSFKRPVLLKKYQHDARNSNSTPSPLQKRGIVRYFDVIVLQSLSSNCLAEESLSWSLSYILQILQSKLFLFCNVSDAWPGSRHQRHGAKKAVGIQHSLPLSNASAGTQDSSLAISDSEPSSHDTQTKIKGTMKQDLEPMYLPDAYEKWVEQNGTISQCAVLKLVYKITQNATLRVCEPLLYMLHVVLEIGVVNENDIGEDPEANLETAVNCLLDLITLIGCRSNDSGLRCSKGRILRHLSHDMFAKLLSLYPEQLNMLTVVYIKGISIKRFLDFMHAFTGLCFGKLSFSPPSSPTRGSLGSLGAAHRSLQKEESDGRSSPEVMDKNESTLINWIGIPMLEKLMAEEKSCKEQHRDLVSKLFTYILSHHPKALRRMVMDGVLKSFSKATALATERRRETSAESMIKAEASTPTKNIKVKMKKKQQKRQISSSGSHQSVLRRFPFVRTKGITVDYSTSDLPFDASSPEHPQGAHPSHKPLKSIRESIKHTSHGSKFKIFKGGKRTRYGTIVFEAVDEEDAGRVFAEKGQKLSKLNLDELLKGMTAFRFMSSFVAPGHLPETSLIAALLDLKAPVLSRAALLLECCYFVHLCNRGGWDSISRPEFASKKDLAMMLYKWGTTIGNKLGRIIAKENDTEVKRGEDLKRYETLERSVLYEGDLSLLTNDCPYTIKLIACQLLLEITAFLRDNYLAHLLEKDTPSACSPRSASESPRRISSVSTHQVSKVPLLRVPMAPAIAFQDETGSSTLASRKVSVYARCGVSTSPKYQRKISRKTMRGHFLHGERRQSRPHKDNQHITSSFDDDDDIPREATDFPWMPSVISFIKSTDMKISQSRSDHVLAKMERSWKILDEGFNALYNPKTDPATPIQRRSALFGDLLNRQKKSVEKGKDPILDYVRSEIAGLQHSPLSVVCKAALVTERLQIMEVLPCAWRLLTHTDQHLASTAAALVLVAGTKLNGFVTSFIKKEMSNLDPNERAKSVLRFGILWKYRFNAFSKLEAGAMSQIKILPPKIEYTLPSPLIGRDPPSTTDAPWVAGSPFPEETGELEIIQTEWYYDEEKRLALKEMQRTEKLKELRRGFQLLTVPLSQEAGTEAKRKLEDLEDEDVWIPQAAHGNVFDWPELFPPSICVAALDVIRLLNDSSLDSNKASVGSLAYQTVWQCLVEEPELFFRTIYEKITKTDKQEEILLVLRTLVQEVPELPAVAGTLLFNNLAGLIMYYNRTNKPGCQERISSVLDVLWKVAPSVSGLVLKDMKQTLRKENCEHVFMITANVPGIKEIRVLYHKAMEKFDVKEGMTFASLIEECEKVFDSFDRSFVLIDRHSGALMEANRLIRDVYTFKRGFPAPVVKLETMDRRNCYEQRQRQALILKVSEISRLNLSKSIFCGNPSQQHITFLFMEFLKQSAFPRKAIEFEFDLSQDRGMGKELMGLDVILKDTWVKFVCMLLGNLHEPTTAGYEIELFLNVINGAFLLLCENMVILRSCLAGFLNISRHFGHIFAISGYRYILPTILKAYSHHQDNSLVVDAVEFIIGQFFILHQSPFLLQLLASAAPMVHSEVTQDLLDCPPDDHIPARVLCKLLLSLDRKIHDSLDILSLVSGEKPLQAYDEACKIESVEFSVADLAIRLAVTVIACEPRSERAREMLVVIAAISPNYLAHLKQQTESSRRAANENDAQELITKELKQLRVFCNYVKVVIDNFKHLSVSFTAELMEAPDADVLLFDDDAFHAKPKILSFSWWAGLLGNVKSWFGWGSDHLTLPDDLDRVSVSEELPSSIGERNALKRFCLPRMSLLFLVTELLTNVSSRVKEIKEMVRRKMSFPDITIEVGQISILTSIVSSVLSLTPKNQEVLSNVGLQRFILSAVPSITWVDDHQIYFAQIVYKVNRVLEKILTHPEYYEFINCDILETILRGINLTIRRQPQLSEIPVIKEMIGWCLKVVLCDNFDVTNYSFSNIAAKVAARLIQANPDAFSLSVVCGDHAVVNNLDQTEKFLINWLLPLCFRLGTGRYDYSRLSGEDIEFALSLVLTLLSPFSSDLNFGSNSNIGSSSSLDQIFFTVIRTRRNTQSIVLRPKSYKILFLALKILVVAFEDNFSPHWKQVAEVMEDLVETNKNEPALWDFFHFIVDNRSPLLIFLLPIIAEKVSDEENLSNEIRSHKTRIERDLWNPCTCICRGDVLRRLLDEWTDLKKDDKVDAPQLLSSPPKGRVRSKSTHNDRSMLLSKFDKDWENYDAIANTEDMHNDPMDGGTAEERVPKRRLSSKRVKIFEEAIVIGEGGEKRGEAGLEQLNRSASGKKILKSRPLLKRQSAEVDEETMEGQLDSEGKEKDSDEGFTERHQAFEWQRFNHVRKRDASKITKTLKRARWRRDNSYRYRQKMQHQISFNEDEEEREIRDDEQQEMKDSKEGPSWLKHRGGEDDEDGVEHEASLKRHTWLRQDEKSARNVKETGADKLIDDVFESRKFIKPFLTENKTEDYDQFESRATAQFIDSKQHTKQCVIHDEKGISVQGSSEEKLMQTSLLNEKYIELSFKKDTSIEGEHSHFEVNPDAHNFIVLKTKQLQDSLYNENKTWSPSASSDEPLINESNSEGDTAKDVVIARKDVDTSIRREQFRKGVSSSETESIEVSMILGTESF